MKKKEYIRPRIKVENIDLNQIIAVSFETSDKDATEDSSSKRFSIWNSNTDSGSSDADDADDSWNNL